MALYGAETWTLRAVDQKQLESFEMWCWRRMEKISWTDHVRNEEVLLRVNEQRNILHEIRKRKANRMGHILRGNCLLKQVIEGKIKGEIEMKRRRGRRRKKLLDDLKDRRGYSYLKEEALDRNMWRNRFGRGVGPVVRQTTEWTNERFKLPRFFFFLSLFLSFFVLVFPASSTLRFSNGGAASAVHLHLSPFFAIFVAISFLQFLVSALITVVPIFFCSSASPRLRSVILQLPNALGKRITAATVYPLTLPFPSAIQSHTNIGIILHSFSRTCFLSLIYE